MINGVTFIAEVKTHAPSGWKSNLTWDELFDVANEYGDILSIHTNELWGGSFSLIKKARTKTKKLILAKGFHKTDDEIKRALENGADLVLVVGRQPLRYTEKCLIEPHSISELKGLPSSTMAVWNSRDLSNLNQSANFKNETFEEARSAFNGWLCQASNIKTINDIKPGANAVLVGTHLLEFIKSIK